MPGRLYKCYLQVKWRRKDRLTPYVLYILLALQELKSHLFDGTLNQGTHLYCTKPAMEHFNKQERLEGTVLTFLIFITLYY